MKWQEVRGLFPNQFVLVSILDYHEDGDKQFVDGGALIRPVADANKEFFQAKEGTMFSHLK